MSKYIIHHFRCIVNTLNVVYIKINLVNIITRRINMKSYNQIIRELREDHDKTQKEIADYLGTTQQVYSRYEKGENEMPIRHIISLCKYYNVSADYLLGIDK